MADNENKEQLMRLMRYNSTIGDINKSLSLDDYVKLMKEGQKNIYFICGQVN